MGETNAAQTMAFGRDMVDLKKQFTFYASYHNNPANVAIHLMCIWPILASAICMLQYTPVLAATPGFISAIPGFQNAKINVAFIVLVVYVVCYVVMEPFVGSCASVAIMAIFVKTGSLVAADAVILGWPVWKVALAIHIAAWILQFIGHSFFEGRAPALLDSLDQALLTAPLFVFMEVFFFLGYRPKFHADVMQQVETNIAAFNDKKTK